MAVSPEVENAIKNSNDKEYYYKLVETNPSFLEYASENIKDDKDIVLKAVNNDGGALEFASTRLKGDKDVLIAATSNAGWTCC